MGNIRFIFAALAMAMLCFACQKPEPIVPDNPENENGFVEAVPDTVAFTNADFIYYGDITGEAFADDWVVKLSGNRDPAPAECGIR